VRQRIEATGGQVATLTACFRSVPALCDWANTAFGRLFPAEPTPHQPGFAGLQAARHETGPTFGVRTIEIPDTVSGGDAVAAFDAEVIARFIRAQVGARAAGRLPRPDSGRAGRSRSTRGPSRPCGCPSR
jgi:hypothetical protein